MHQICLGHQCQSLDINAMDRDITVVKGSKTKPGFISFEEDNEHKSDQIEFIVGVVNKRSKIAKRKNYYTVAWEWSCTTLHDIDFESTTIDRAISQYSNIRKGMRHSSTKKRNMKEQQHVSRSLLKECSKEGNMKDSLEAIVIESDDDYSDDDGFEFENLHINHNVNDETKCYSTIRHSKNLESDLSMFFETQRGSESSTTEHTNGLKWEMNGNLQAPTGLAFRPKTKIRGNISCFSTELESLLAFLPLKYWVKHLEECNNYVEKELDKKYSSDKFTKKTSRKFNGMKWKPIKIDELMIFYAIIIQMACRPFPGKKYEECWNYTKDWFTNCQHMKKTRFKQIRAALHWCENPHSHSKLDTLYKVRPIIDILEKTIGKYLEVGQEVALDETTIGLYHAYAKALIYYNPSKPRGKHHCKLFVLCENDYWSAINFHFAHRSYDKEKSSKNKETENNKTMVNETSHINSDSDESNTKTKVNKDEIGDNEPENKEVPKMVQLVTSMCKCLKGTGVVVNMDNLYSSPEAFIALKKLGIYARGTFRSNRKYLPSFVRFTKSETLKLPRGCFRLATNKEYNLSCYAWNDKNPVHVISSADATDLETTQRRSKSKKINVLCPSAVKRYNKGMQGVDQFNKLLTLFSLASLKFDKYYKKVAMVLLDFAITNAYLHFQIANNTKNDKNYSRVKFMENLQEQLINVDWAEKVRRFQMDHSEDESIDSNDEMHFMEKLFDKGQTNQENAMIDGSISTSLKKVCNPVAMQPSSMNLFSDDLNSIMLNRQLKVLAHSQRVCQICEFEGRGRRRTGVNYCPNHNIKACTLKSPHPQHLKQFRLGGVVLDVNFSEASNNWLCPDSSLTCWEKAHNWYIPNGLFHLKHDTSITNEKNSIIDFTKVSRINWSSSMAKERKRQLKESIQSRKGRLKEGEMIQENSFNDSILNPTTTDEASELRTHQFINSIPNDPVKVPKIYSDDEA